jgi:biotin synthase
MTRFPVRHDWTRDEVLALHDRPLPELIGAAQAVLGARDPGRGVQRSRLLNIKTGGCAEDCGYCSQSAKVRTGLVAGRLMDVAAVAQAAAEAKAEGAQRFCMGAAWREVKDRDLPALCDMVKAVRAQGLQTCMTLGMLSEDQAQALAEAGLEYYNHNLDTGPEYYDRVVTTRTLQDRLDTLGRVREAGMAVCCGGILGMGEAPSDRADLFVMLAGLKPHPESVPVNRLVPVEGTPLGKSEPIGDLDFVRWIAVARVMFPTSEVRLAAGRQSMGEAMQALCLLAGADSVFIGERLLTTPNPQNAATDRLLAQFASGEAATDTERQIAGAQA